MNWLDSIIYLFFCLWLGFTTGVFQLKGLQFWLIYLPLVGFFYYLLIRK